MGKSQREKGKRGEREVARILRNRGLDAKRGVQYQGSPDSPDVTGLPGYHVEVKFVERLDLRRAIEQSKADAGEDEVPVVVHRRSREPWNITMSFEDFLDLYEKAHEI